MFHDSLEQTVSHTFRYGELKPSFFSDSKAITLVRWDSDEGKKRLFESSSCSDFFRLASFYQPQKDPVSCGIATSVTILNALAQPKHRAPSQQEREIFVPPKGQKVLFPGYSQEHFLKEESEETKDKQVVQHQEKDEDGRYSPGFTLDELQKVIEAYRFKVQSSNDMDEMDLVRFRKKMVDVFLDDSSFVLIHFRSDLLGSYALGHISPLAAYHELSDSILVMDVASHKGPWYWAPVDELYQATFHKYENDVGGFLIVSIK